MTTKAETEGKRMKQTAPASHPMTATERSALAYLVNYGPQTCASLGAALWGKPYRQPQSYCRPAGRLLHALSRRGHVRRCSDGPVATLWGAI